MDSDLYEDIDSTENGTTGAPDPFKTAEDLAVEVEAAATETTEEGTATETADQSPEEKAEAEEHKKKTGSQRARERAERLERENQALRDALARGQGAPATTPETDTPASKPDPNDPKWKSHAEYEEARIAHEVDRRISEREQRTRAQAEQEKWKQREEATAAKYEDYQEVFQDFIALRPSDTLKQAILKIEVGPEIVYFLGNNATELRRLNALDPVGQVLEIGELRARFKTPPPKTEKKTTQAPPPVKPLSGATKPVVNKDSTADYEQY